MRVITSPLGHRAFALNFRIWHNWLTDATVKRSLIAYYH